MRNDRYSQTAAEKVAEWAKAVLCMRALANSPNRCNAELGSIPPVGHPAILMQAALQEVFRPTSPVEIFSDDQPSFTPRSPEQEDWVPIDVLLGRYEAKTRTISIFHKNVQFFAKVTFHCDVSDLEDIVRLHEYGHALGHLGVFSKEERAMEERAITHNYRPSDWKSFLKARSRAFRSLHPGAHEFLAQVLCWTAIGALQPLVKRHTLQELFVAVMRRQPPEYRLSAETLGKSLYGDPTAMLTWARETPRKKPTHRTSHREVVQALLCATFPDTA